MILFALVGMAKQCSKVDEYSKFKGTLNNDHPPIIHKMEQVLAEQSSSDDSATAEWASGFWQNYEKEFNNYYPAHAILHELFYSKTKDQMEIHVIGGNWCSDTRREVPRLTKVLHQIGFDPDKFHYYQVDRDKKAIAKDFAAGHPVTLVPTIFIYVNGVEKARILENPRESWEKELLRYQ